MPFINSKVSVKTTKEQQTTLKQKLGQAIAIIPGKSESWLMIDLEDEQLEHFYTARQETILERIQNNETLSEIERKYFDEKITLKTLTDYLQKAYNSLEKIVLDKK